MFRWTLKGQAALSHGVTRRPVVRVAALRQNFRGISRPSASTHDPPGEGRSLLTVPSLRRLMLAFAAALLLLAAHPAAGLAACANPGRVREREAGQRAERVAGRRRHGDSTIQGYATSMSVNGGQTIRFKVKTTATDYHIDIYRLGYYQGNGARLQAVEHPADRDACRRPSPPA